MSKICRNAGFLGQWVGIFECSLLTINPISGKDALIMVDLVLLEARGGLNS